HRRTRHERDLELTGAVVHPQGVGPFRAEVLVAEDGDHPLVFHEGVRDLLEEATPGVEMLLLLVIRVVAVLPMLITPSTGMRSPPRVSAPSIVSKIGTSCFLAWARARSRVVNWSTYIEATLSAGPAPPSCFQPSRIIPRSTSACGPAS